MFFFLLRTHSYDEIKLNKQITCTKYGIVVHVAKERKGSGEAIG